jgi:hypothetical protein
MTNESAAPDSDRRGYRNYAEVPWYRRSGVNSLFIVAHLLTCGAVPLILWVCINLVTGDVYYDKRTPDGELTVWSMANKVVAVVILVFNVVVFVLTFTYYYR